MNLIKITLASALGLALIAPVSTAQVSRTGNQTPNVERAKRQKDGPGVRGVDRKDQTPDTKRPEKKERKPDVQRPDKKDQERPAKRPEAKGKKVSEQEMVKKAQEEEAKHRERIAKIKRLREIVSKQGDRAKLEKLDKMEASENARYGRMVAKAKEVLGERRFKEVYDEMQKGASRRAKDGDKVKRDKPVEKKDVPKRP
jgi:hypothetical protein